MAQPTTSLTPPIFSPNSTIWFSAYRFGWGYCAFALPAQTVCEKLGAADESTKQLALAFELGKLRIVRAIEQRVPPLTGERVELSPADL
ncbi:hypothetical protein FAZ95_38150 [Trinickia violacea]|uniref:Uncharacterized protein n=1 Tax=Trinickia violacea TaxID=2571746 RepID=A0A4P8J6L8_9BURK|nr:hypothetical protein [Trinickia violacea]QCP54689.1 hypothetical protein FAZ95_38150 [Trinickia violacea]